MLSASDLPRKLRDDNCQEILIISYSKESNDCDGL